MGRLLQLIAVAVVARAAASLVREWLDPDSRRRFNDDKSSGSLPLHRGAMVRDPQCGVHIPESTALRVERGGISLFFCSAECRDRYAEAE